MEPLSGQTVLVVGSVLLHFVWQGTLIGMAAAAALAVVPATAASVRYALAGAGLLGMLLAPLVTLGLAWQPAPAGLVAPGTALAGLVETGVASGWAPGPAAGWLTSSAAWLPTIVVVWAVGVTLLLARLVASWWRTERVRRRDLREPDGIIVALTHRLRDRLGVRRLVTLAETPWIDTPMVVGWLRPTILLPIGAFTGLSMQQVEAVLAHELAHIRRHDYVVNALQHLVETVFFYHPAVWWLSRQVRIEREHCCDDVAVAACGDPAGYVRALAVLEEGRQQRTALALGVADGSLVSRVRRLLGRPHHEGRPALPLLLALATLLFVVASTAVRPAAAPTTQAEQSNGKDGAEGAPLPRPSEVRIGGDIKEPRKLVHVNPIYPDSAREAGISGVVILELQVEPDGSVSDIEVMRSIPALDQAAINAVRQWRYEPTLLDGEPVRVMMVVTVNFALGSAARSEQLENLRVEPVDVEPVDVPRVGGNTREPRLIRRVSPVYPEAARAAGVSGVVILRATIDAEGNVRNPRILRSVPMLDQAALDAVRHWKYEPPLVDGKPSPVAMTMTINFVAP